MQTSQLGRIAYREILIIITFRIPTGGAFENSLTSEAQSDICETCMMEGFCESNEQLKGVIYISKKVPS